MNNLSPDSGLLALPALNSAVLVADRGFQAIVKAGLAGVIMQLFKHLKKAREVTGKSQRA